MKCFLKNLLPHTLVIFGFVIISLTYFNPVLQGKKIFQSDIMQYIGMAKQQNDFRANTGEETYWTNSAFGGMPTYQLGAHYPNNYIKKIDRVLRFLPRPADYLFLYLIGFYVLLLVLKVDYKLAVLGSLAFGFSTYLIIILGVGHNAKAHAIAYMPLVLSGILLTFQKKYVFGFLLTTVALGLELSANHYQMTFYLLLLVLVLGLVFLIEAYKNSALVEFFKGIVVLLVAVLLSIGLNATNLLATQEYVKESTRGKSELTINPDKSPKEITNGLNREYITAFSYGKVETLNLFIPRFMGGGSYENVGKNSETYAYFKKLGATPIQALNEVKQTPTYWGEQPIVEAPAYIGAVVIFLFILALYLVKGPEKRWLIIGTVMSLLLSYGKNLEFLTDLFIDYFPLYNKFRAVSSIQVILELCIPILAVLGLKELIAKGHDKKEQVKALKNTLLITLGVTVTLLIFKNSLFDFVGNNDGRFIDAYGQGFIDAVKSDRIVFFTNDTLRTLILILVSAVAIWFFLKEKVSKDLLLVILGILILFDLVAVDRRYVNNEDFVAASSVQNPYQANQIDIGILKDTTHYRIFDLTTGNTKPSYFHNSLNGYHAAKMKRYDDVFNFYITQNHLGVLSMLNTKYIIAQNEEGNATTYENSEAHGNAWFIKNILFVKTPDEEILSLDSLDVKNNVVINKDEFGQFFKTESASAYRLDSIANVKLVAYQPNYLKYKTNNLNDGFLVFSENYYAQGWNAYLDGKMVPHLRVNYILRGLQIPSGNHVIEFKFEPQVIETGSTITMLSSVTLLLLLISGLFFEFRKKV
ncbi:MAG: YfhO family protein [Flavobacteriaceae bacterium]|nr:YfhO family protein [Flavobacteriaceae bacterium]